MRKYLNSVAALACALTLTGCSSMHSLSNQSISAESGSRSGSRSWASLAWSSQSSTVRFQKSGTVILSGNLSGSASVANSSVAAENQPVKFAPLVGYLPPTLGFIPAENETWLEVDRLSKTVVLYKGKTKMKEMHGEGSVSIDAGEYFIQQKQKHPLWYATDDYFSRRKLSVPSKEDRLRYRRGAYGPFAIFPSTNFPIHSGPVWSSDVGGLRISKGDLSSIYYELPVGAPVVVK